MGQYAGLGAGQFSGLYPIDKASPPILDYYVSNLGAGNGHRPGAPMSLSAFKALSIPTNARVFFNKGETFDISGITLNENNIKISSYGVGALPILRGSVDIGAQTWTNEGGNLYSTPYSGTVKWLYVNGVAQQLAESPLYTITSQPDGTHLRASSLISAWGSSIVGATVVVKEYYFAPSLVTTVTAYDNATGEITIADAVRTGITSFSFKLYNQLQFINAAGEFFHDTSANKLYYRTSGSSPAGTDIRVCGNDVGIKLGNGVKGTVIDGVSITQFFQAGIMGKDNSGTLIQNCNINNIRSNGIFLYGINFASTITSNTLTNCELNGMYFGAISAFNITWNTINNIGRGLTGPFCQKLGTSFSYYEQEVATGIAFTWDETNFNKVPFSGNIQYNAISNCGYIGILFLGDVVVQNNVVHDYLIDFVDGGGIYTINHPEAPYGGRSLNAVIDNNIIYNAVGSTVGTPGNSGFAVLVYGIYLDIGCDNVKIRNNSIANVFGGGININYGNQGTQVTGNNIIGGAPTIGVSWTAINYVNDTGNAYLGRTNQGNICTGNTLCLSRNAVEVCVTVNDAASVPSFNPFANVGSYTGNSNNNIYINPYGTYIGRIVANSTFPTLATWKTTYGKDASSTALTNYIVWSNLSDAGFENVMVVNPTSSTAPLTIGAGYSGYKDVTGATITSTSQSIPAWGSYIYLSISGDKTSSFIAATAGVTSSASGATLTPTYPSSILNGDLLIVHASSASGTLVVSAATAGWSVLIDDHSFSNAYLFYKIADGTETGTASFTWTGGASINKVARMYQFRYTPTSSFYEDYKRTVSSGTTLTAPTLTASSNRESGMSFVTLYNNTTVVAYTGSTGSTWAESVAEYAPVSNAGLQLQRADLRANGFVFGGTMTTGAGGAVALNMVLKNII